MTMYYCIFCYYFGQ